MPTAFERRSFPSAAINGDDLLARLGGVLRPSQDAMSSWRPCDAPWDGQSLYSPESRSRRRGGGAVVCEATEPVGAV
jgi:hypothetical protein